MRAKLIWNTNAGSVNLSSDEIIAALAAVGIEAELCETVSLEHLDEVLADPSLEYVIVAGGDGSVRQVVKRIRGREAKLLILPMGTANNLAGALGIRLPVLELIALLDERVLVPLDVGLVRCDDFEDIFMEGAGVGLFAQTMHGYGEDNGKSVLRALTAVIGTITAPPVLNAKLYIDGEQLETELSMLEVLNTPAIGPRLNLVTTADPSDGWLEVMTIEPKNGVGFLNYTVSALGGSLEALENVTVRRAKRVHLEWDGGALHADGDSQTVAAGVAEFWLEEAALQVVLPAPRESAKPIDAAPIDAEPIDAQQIDAQQITVEQAMVNAA